MKRLVQLGISSALLLPVTGMAAEAAEREDGSMVLVYLFLATCGLIVLLQLLPVLAMVFGIVRGLFSKRRVPKPVPVKHRQR